MDTVVRWPTAWNAPMNSDDIGERPPNGGADAGTAAQARLRRAELRYRLTNVLVGVSSVFAVLLLYIASNKEFAVDIGSLFRINAFVAFPAAGLLLFFVAVSASVVQYLQTGSLRRPQAASPQASGGPGPGQGDRAPRERQDQSFGAAAKGDSVTTPLPPEDPHFADITRYTTEMVQRLVDAIEEQGRRNNINLGFGFFVTLVGIGALLFFVREYKDIDPTKPWSMLNFLPRLSLVILIELFAYFFLNLYKNGLVEVKYLQNELINARMRLLALRTAVRESDKDSATYILKSLADTDRNSAFSAKSEPKGASGDVLKTAQEALKLAAKVVGRE